MSLRRFLPVIVSAAALCAPSLLFGQGQNGVEKVDVFGGYSWYRAGCNLPSVVVDGQTFSASTAPDFQKGGAGQFTYNVNRWAGLAVDGAGHSNDFGHAYSVAAGPQFKVRGAHVTLFGEALLGMQSFAPKQFAEQNAAALIVGGGIDYRVSSHLSIRPFQGDYVTSYYNKLSPPATTNGLGGARFQAGLVLKFGLPPANVAPATAVCAAEPEAVQEGTPVTISVTPSGFLPMRKLSYSYESNGGKVSGSGTTATVDTTGLTPGHYTVGAKVADDGKGKHQQTVSCDTGFTVRELPKHPPTLSISAAPISVVAGDISTITANGSSADNRPLSYDCTTRGGQLSGNGPRYTLETAGVPASTIVVNCTVSDDRNLTASASVSVQVTARVAPPPAAQTVAKKYGTIDFQRDARRPTRVDNEAKGELDRYADALAAAPDAKGVVVGYASAKEAKTAQGSKNFAAQRAVNTKDYVTKEKGIDPARVEARSGGEGQKVELWIIPAGASFPQADSTVVDEVKVKAVPRVARKRKKAAHRKAEQQEQ